MKVFDIISEGKVDEAIPFTKKAKMMKQAGKAAKGATKDEARRMEVELLTYLKTSKQPATVGAVQKYFDQKGYGAISRQVMKQFQTKGQKKVARSQARQDKAQAAGAQAAKLGGLAKQQAQKAGNAIGKAATAAKNASGVVPKSQIGNQGTFKSVRAGMYSESEKRWKQTSMSSAEAIKKYGKENVKVKKGGLRNGDDMVSVFVESQIMHSEAAAGDTLTKGEIKNIIGQVVAKGFGGAAGFDKGAFAQTDAPKKTPAGDAQVQKAIDIVKKAGYKVVN